MGAAKEIMKFIAKGMKQSKVKPQARPEKESTNVLKSLAHTRKQMQGESTRKKATPGTKDYANKKEKMKPGPDKPAGATKMLSAGLSDMKSITYAKDKLAKAKLELKRHNIKDSRTMHEAMERRVRLLEADLEKLIRERTPKKGN